MAKDISNAAKEGEELGLTADELAFYDALTKPQAVKNFYDPTFQKTFWELRISSVNNSYQLRIFPE